MEITMATDRLETIVSLAKRRGFVYPSSEIYGGLRASWDYGPLGVELKNNALRGSLLTPQQIESHVTNGGNPEDLVGQQTGLRQDQER